MSMIVWREKEAPDTCGNYDDTFVGFWVDGCMI